MTYTDRITNVEQSVFISQKSLGLRPIDLMYRLKANSDQALNELDDRILKFIHSHQTPRLDRPSATQRMTGKVTGSSYKPSCADCRF